MTVGGMAPTQRIAILSGGGQLPLILARTIAAHGGRAHLVAVRGEAGPEVETYPHTWVTWGAVNRIIATLKRESDGTMMIAGSVSRPDLMRLKPDLGVLTHLPKVLAMLRGGDDAVLTRIVRFFEAQGLTVKGVADVAPELLAQAGRMGAPIAATAESAHDMRLGLRVLDALADLDVGQGVVVDGGRVLAIEGVEGTDRMLTRVAQLPRAQTSGVFVKVPKRGQELRVDLPTVGAQTIAALKTARVPKLVVAAGKTLLLERDEMERRAVEAGIAIEAVATDRVAAVQAAAVPGVVAATVLGRVAPTRKYANDARTAAEVVWRLDGFGCGDAAVVVREHVLTIAGAEGAQACIARTAALRQWGKRRFVRAAGAAAMRCDATMDEAALSQVVATLAGAGIAGLALLTASGQDVPASVRAAADAQGIFLIQLPAVAGSFEAM